jgi:hypothetical protein
VHIVEPKVLNSHQTVGYGRDADEPVIEVIGVRAGRVYIALPSEPAASRLDTTASIDADCVSREELDEGIISLLLLDVGGFDAPYGAGGGVSLFGEDVEGVGGTRRSRDREKRDEGNALKRASERRRASGKRRMVLHGEYLLVGVGWGFVQPERASLRNFAAVVRQENDADR